MTFSISISNLVFKKIIILVSQLEEFINNNHIFISFIDQNIRQLIIRIIKINFRFSKINKKAPFVKENRVKIKSNFMKLMF